MTTNAAPILEMTGITKSFPGVKALEDVDFRLLPGEVHALLGENGAGKSTLLKVLTGVLQIDAGTIELKGRAGALREPARGAARGDQRRLPGGQPLPEPLGGGEHLHRPRAAPARADPLARDAPQGRRGARARRRPRRRVAALLSTHSLAVQQMVAIARAIDISADVLILDEPTSSLDRGEVDQLFARDPPARGPGDRDRVRLALPRSGLRDRRPGHGAAERPARRRVADRRAQPRRARLEDARDGS